MVPDPTLPTSIAAFARDAEAGVLATSGADGTPAFSTVLITATEAGALVLSVRAHDPAISHLEHNPAAALMIGAGSRVVVQLEGDAILVAGRRRERSRTLQSDHEGTPTVFVDDAQVAIFHARWVSVTEHTAGLEVRSEARWL